MVDLLDGAAAGDCYLINGDPFGIPATVLGIDQLHAVSCLAGNGAIAGFSVIEKGNECFGLVLGRCHVVSIVDCEGLARTVRGYFLGDPHG